MAEFPDISGRTLVGFFRLVVEPMEDPPNAPAHTTANTAGAAYQTKRRRVDFMHAVFHLHTRKASHWYVRSISRSSAEGKDMCELRVMELIGDLASLRAAAFLKADKQWEGAKTHWLSQEKR